MCNFEDILSIIWFNDTIEKKSIQRHIVEHQEVSSHRSSIIVFICKYNALLIIII